MMTDDSLVEWASGWVPDEPPGQRARFVEALRDELKQRTPYQPEWCAKCVFPKHAHYEQDGKMIALGCTGFVPAP